MRLRQPNTCRGDTFSMNASHTLVAPLSLLLVAVGSFAAQDNLLESESQGQSGIIEQQTVPGAAGSKTTPASGQPPASVPAQSNKVPARSGPAAIPPERIYSAGRRAEPRLWAMLNSGRYTELNGEIQRLRALDPAWQPPAELSYWLRHHLKLQAAAKSPRQQPVTTRSSRPPSPLTSVSRRNKGSASPVAATPRSTLAKARPSPALAVKPAVTSATHRPSGHTSRILIAQYGAAITAAATLDRAHQSSRALAHLQPWETMIRQRQDGGALELLGWLRFNTEDFAGALPDFRQAGVWRPTASAAQGEMLALERLQRFDELAHAARRSQQRWPELQKPAANALRTIAAQRHQAGAYTEASALLTEANELSPPDRNGRLLAAWNNFRLARWREAADQFVTLYREAPDQDSAQGVLLSLKKLDVTATAEAAAIANEPGPLQTLWRDDVAETHYQAKRFLAAHTTSPDRFPALANIDSPSVTGGLAGHWRDGDSGMGRLRQWDAPVAGYQYRQGATSGHFIVNRSTLESGSLPPRQPVGSPPRSLPAAYPFTPTTELEEGLGWEISLRREGELTVAAQLGMTPTGGELSARLYAAAGIASAAADYGWRLSAHTLPVTESLLSYTGLRDPYTGNAWGRVFRSGLELQGWRAIAPQWNAAGTVRAEVYRGKEVADNSGVYARVGLGRDLQVTGFNYFNIGPVLDYRHFDKNLSHFTRGHGGYYSPQRDLGLALAINAQTEEGRDWLLRGEAYVGVRHSYQASSSWLPLAEDGRFFAGTTETGFSGGLTLQGVWRLAPQWQLGAAAAYERSPSFTQSGGYLFLRYLLEPRPAVFSSDLEGAMPLDWR